MTNRFLNPGQTALPLLAFLLGALLLPSAAAAQLRSINIVVVDLDMVAARSPAGKALQAKLLQFQKQIQGEAEAKSGKARDIRQRIADGVNSLTEERLQELQKEYEDAMLDLRRFQDDKQREGQKMQADGLQEIERQLEPIFERLSEANDYDLILNRVPGVVLMANERVDITQQVIAELGGAGGQ